MNVVPKLSFNSDWEKLLKIISTQYASQSNSTSIQQIFYFHFIFMELKIKTKPAMNFSFNRV